MKKMFLIFGLILFLSSCSTVEDTENPVISILGDPIMVLEISESYVEPGVETSDNSGVDPIVTISGEVDTTTLGLYTLTYTATDKSNNSSSTSRVVEVVDTISPTIELNGASQIIIEIGDEFSDPGFLASDNSGVDPLVTVTGEINNTMVGLYTLTYTATDNADHSTSTSRVVEVIDTVSPYIELVGDRFVYIELGSEYIEPGILINENSAEILTVNVFSVLDVNMLAYFDLEYYVSDSSGNVSNVVSRGVIITLPYHGLYDSLNNIGWVASSEDVVYDFYTFELNSTITYNITYTYNKIKKEFSYSKEIITLSNVDYTTVVGLSYYDLRIDLVNGRGYVEFTLITIDNSGTETTEVYTLEYDYYTDTVINISDSLFESDMNAFLESTTIEFNDLLNELYSIQIIDFY